MKINYEQTFPHFSRALDFEQLTRDYPPPPEFYKTVLRMPRAELEALKNRRFLATVKRGWEIPFFQRHWGEAGLEPGDIRGLDDIEKIPPYTVHDIRKSLERNPPFGDFIGMAPGGDNPLPLVLHTSGGTTGLPRPMLYAPQDREVMAILSARRYAMQGMVPGAAIGGPSPARRRASRGPRSLRHAGAKPARAQRCGGGRPSRKAADREWRSGAARRAPGC